MIQGLPVEHPPGDSATVELVLTACPLCGEDEAEPVAVGDDFAHGTTRNSFLVLSCAACGLLYLSPRPAVEAWPRLYPHGYFRTAPGAEEGFDEKATRRLLRACGSLPPEARILEVAYGPTLHLNSIRKLGPPSWTVEVVTPHQRLAGWARESGCAVYDGRPKELEDSGVTYDLILLVDGLEHCEAPIDELGSLRRMLRPGGRLLIVTPNAASGAWRMFRGRHWAGYDFPRHRCLFSPETVRKLASRTGFVVERVGSHTDRRIWVHSASNFARDWAAPTPLRRFGKFGFAALGFVDAVLSAGRFAARGGSHLEAVLRSPVEAAA